MTTTGNTSGVGNSLVASPAVLPPRSLNAAIKRVLKTDPKAQFSVDPGTQSATFLSGTFVPRNVKGLSGTKPALDATAGAKLLADGFLKEHGKLFGVSSPATQLELKQQSVDELGMAHLRYQQVHEGLPVFNQDLIVHTRDGAVTTAAGQLLPNIKVDLEPGLSPKQALAKLRRSLDEFKGAKVESSRLGVYAPQSRTTPHLAYEMDVSGGRTPTRLYVDANTGERLTHWSLLKPIRQRETYDAEETLNVPGKLVLTEKQSRSRDPIANVAHKNAGIVYDFYKEKFGRDSIDDKGMKLVSTVHYDKDLGNAYWDSSRMLYGDGGDVDGDGTIDFKPLAKGLDVAGHEFTHGVTERSAGLEYEYQSGALNESWSDVMGESIEQWHEGKRARKPRPDWKVGEDIFTPTIRGDAIRNLDKPGTAYPGDPQPAHMKDYVNTDEDYGGVHINSGIPNKAAREYAGRVGLERMNNVWYRALTSYFTPKTKFDQAALLTAEAAKDLYGKDSKEVKDLIESWRSVGVDPKLSGKQGQPAS